MLGKVKKWLGIEGVKLELLLPEEVTARSGFVVGKIQFQSMNTQTVTAIKVVLIERYTRGRGAEKLIDEYELGSTRINQIFEVPVGEIVEVDFQLPFRLVKSDIDEFAARNFLFRSIAGAARKMRGAYSEYRIEAEAQVKGVALNPFDRKDIVIKV